MSPEQVHVRRAEEADINSVLPLWRELMESHAAFDPRYKLVSGARVQVERHLRVELSVPDSLVIVAGQGAAVVGYCRASVQHLSPVFEPHPHGFISELHVTPPFRRMSIGSQIFRYAQHWFSEQGIRRLELVALNANENSRAFWRSVGCECHAEHHHASLEFV